MGDGVENVKNELKNRQEQPRGKKEKKDKEEQQKKKYFSDPALGHHIDIES